MEHVLIQVVYDCFQFGFSFVRWILITHSNISNYWDTQAPSWGEKVQR